MSIPLLALLVPVGLYYFLLLRLAWGVRRPTDAIIREIDLSMPSHPVEVRTFLGGATAALRDCVRLGSFAMGYGSRAQQYCTLFEAPETGDLITLTATVLRTNDHLRIVRNCVVTAGFSDESELSTTSASIDYPLCLEPGSQLAVIPAMGDLARLREIHARLRERDYVGKEVVTPWREGVFSWLRKEEEETRLRRVRRGFEYIDSRNGKMRPTWKTSLQLFLMLAWPFGAIRRKRTDAEARALLRTLGLPLEYPRLEPLKVPMPAAYMVDDEPLFCPKCDYNLTGLAASRCPECGSAFEVDVLREQHSKRPQPINLAEGIALALKPAGPVLWISLVGLGSLKMMKILPDFRTEVLGAGLLVQMLLLALMIRSASASASQLGVRIAVNRALAQGGHRSGLQDKSVESLIRVVMVGAYALIGVALIAAPGYVLLLTL